MNEDMPPIEYNGRKWRVRQLRPQDITEMQAKFTPEGGIDLKKVRHFQYLLWLALKDNNVTEEELGEMIDLSATGSEFTALVVLRAFLPSWVYRHLVLTSWAFTNLSLPEE